MDLYHVKKPIQKDQIRREKGGTEGQSWRKDLAAIRYKRKYVGITREEITEQGDFTLGIKRVTAQYW